MREEGFVQLRHFSLGHGLSLDFEDRRLPLQSFVTVVLGEGHLEALLVSGLEAQEPLFEAGDHAAAADHDLSVFRGAALKGLFTQVAREVDGNLVAVLGCPALFHHKGLPLLPEALDHGVNVGIRNLGFRRFHRGFGEIPKGDLREHLEGGRIGELAVVIFRDPLEARLPRGADGLLRHRLEDRTLHQLAGDLLANPRAETTLNFLQRHPPGAEARQARTAGRILKALLNLLLEVLHGKLHRHLALERLGGLDRYLHTGLVMAG